MEFVAAMNHHCKFASNSPSSGRPEPAGGRGEWIEWIEWSEWGEWGEWGRREAPRSSDRKLAPKFESQSQLEAWKLKLGFVYPSAVMRQLELLGSKLLAA